MNNRDNENKKGSRHKLWVNKRGYTIPISHIIITFILVMITLIWIPNITVKHASAYTPITPDKMTMYICGETYQINFDRLKANAVLTYKSSNSSVATVDNKGLVTPKSIGKATITIRIKQDNRSYTSKVQISVVAPYITIVNKIAEIEVGDTYIFQAMPTGLTNPNIIWWVSDKALGTIRFNTGKFTAKSTGNIVITAKDRISGKIDKIRLVIKEKQVKQFSIINKIDNAWCNTSYQFRTEGTEVEEANVVWSVSNPELATINEDGVIITKKVGTVTVTATDEESQQSSSNSILIKDIKESSGDIFKVSNGYIIGLNDTSCTEIKIPEKINGETIIGVNWNALQNQKQLKIVIFPSSIEEINDSALDGCSSLESAVFVEGTKKLRLHEYSFYYCDNLKEMILPYECEASFGQYCIANNKNLTRFNIPIGTTAIDISAFAELEGIHEYILPDTVKYIGESAFSHNNNFTVVIPEEVTGIDINAFYECSDFIIRTPEGSYAETLARQNYITYENY